MKYKKIRAGLKQRRELHAQAVAKSRDGGRDIHRPGSLNGRKTGTVRLMEGYSHKATAQNRSRRAIAARS